MRKGTAGYTLMEVLVSMIMVGVSATATVKGMVFTTDMVGQNTRLHKAIDLAQATVERLRDLSYDGIASSTTTSTDGKYTIVTAVNEDSPEYGMKTIKVTVSWTWKGLSKSYALDTVFAQLTES